MIGRKMTTVLVKNASVIYGKPFGDVVSIDAMKNSFAAESQSVPKKAHCLGLDLNGFLTRRNF